MSASWPATVASAASTIEPCLEDRLLAEWRILGERVGLSARTGRTVGINNRRGKGEAINGVGGCDCDACSRIHGLVDPAADVDNDEAE